MIKIEKTLNFAGGGRHNTVLSVLVIVSLLVGSFIAGGIFKENSYAVSGNLNTENGSWTGNANDNNATITVGYTGRYQIRVTGGGSGSGDTLSTGGDLTGRIDLKKGDVLKAVVLNGGSAGYCNGQAGKGGDAVIIYLNNKPIIGAGGAGGYYYLSGKNHALSRGPSTTIIDNSKFSSGAGGTAEYETSSSQFGNGGNGNTISGCTAAVNKGRAAEAGQNYMDNSVELVEMVNGSTTASFNVTTAKLSEADNPANIAKIASANTMIVNELKKLSENDNETNFERIATATEDIASKMGSDNNTFTNVEICTVVSGREFNEYVNTTNDSTIGGTLNGITVINNNDKDGVVKIIGKLDTVGDFQFNIDSIIYTIRVIEEPDSTNVSAVLQ